MGNRRKAEKENEGVIIKGTLRHWPLGEIIIILIIYQGAL